MIRGASKSRIKIIEMWLKSVIIKIKKTLVWKWMRRRWRDIFTTKMMMKTPFKRKGKKRTRKMRTRKERVTKRIKVIRLWRAIKKQIVRFYLRTVPCHRDESLARGHSCSPTASHLKFQQQRCNLTTSSSSRHERAIKHKLFAHHRTSYQGEWKSCRGYHVAIQKRFRYVLPSCCTTVWIGMSLNFTDADMSVSPH